MVCSVNMPTHWGLGALKRTVAQRLTMRSGYGAVRRCETPDGQLNPRRGNQLTGGKLGESSRNTCWLSLQSAKPACRNSMVDDTLSQCCGSEVGEIPHRQLTERASIPAIPITSRSEAVRKGR